MYSFHTLLANILVFMILAFIAKINNLCFNNVQVLMTWQALAKVIFFISLTCSSILMLSIFFDGYLEIKLEDSWIVVAVLSYLFFINKYIFPCIKIKNDEVSKSQLNVFVIKTFILLFSVGAYLFIGIPGFGNAFFDMSLFILGHFGILYEWLRDVIC